MLLKGMNLEPEYSNWLGFSQIAALCPQSQRKAALEQAIRLDQKPVH